MIIHSLLFFSCYEVYFAARVSRRWCCIAHDIQRTQRTPYVRFFPQVPLNLLSLRSVNLVPRICRFTKYFIPITTKDGVVGLRHFTFQLASGMFVALIDQLFPSSYQASNNRFMPIL